MVRVYDKSQKILYRTRHYIHFIKTYSFFLGSILRYMRGDFMNVPHAHYMTGSDYFRDGESIYVNKATEKADPHPHSHDFLEIAYVASGCGIHRLGNVEYSVSQGDLFIINYNILHEFRSLREQSESPLIVYNCVFNPDFLDYSLVNCKDFYDITHHFLFRSLFPDEGENKSDLRLHGHDSRGIEELYEKMFREYNLREDGYIEILRAYVIELLITIFRAFRNSNMLEEGNDNRRRQVIEKVMLYMKNNYTNELKLEDLSLMAFLSRNYFCKLFKDVTNMTVMEYAQKIRIEEACILLLDTDKKIIDIISEVGYRDIKFFNQIFKRKTGMTPSKYRQNR